MNSMIFKNYLEGPRGAKYKSWQPRPHPLSDIQIKVNWHVERHEGQSGQPRSVHSWYKPPSLSNPCPGPGLGGSVDFPGEAATVDGQKQEPSKGGNEVTLTVARRQKASKRDGRVTSGDTHKGLDCSTCGLLSPEWLGQAIILVRTPVGCTPVVPTASAAAVRFHVTRLRGVRHMKDRVFAIRTPIPLQDGK